jgi:hypothetical protein
MTVAKPGIKANIKPKIIARGTRMVLPPLCRISGSLTSGSLTTGA